MNIQGINEYRLQTSADVLEAVDAILEAGITSGDDGSMVINPADGVTLEQQESSGVTWMKPELTCSGNH